MSLRKSPVRTPALLAANRANAARSTGPRTAAGKRASALNALRHGYRSHALSTAEPSGARDIEAFEAFCRVLQVALVAPPGEIGERAVRERALGIWRAKRILDHWLEKHPGYVIRSASPAAQRKRRLPPPVTFVVDRRGYKTSPGWKVKVSISLRWGRTPASLIRGAFESEAGLADLFEWQLSRQRLRTKITVTSFGHPWTWRYLQRFRTNPECHRKNVAWEDVITDFDPQRPASGLTPRDLGIVMPGRRPTANDQGWDLDSVGSQTNPEYHRKSVDWKNVITELAAAAKDSARRARRPDGATSGTKADEVLIQVPQPGRPDLGAGNLDPAVALDLVFEVDGGSHSPSSGAGRFAGPKTTRQGSSSARQFRTSCPLM